MAPKRLVLIFIAAIASIGLFTGSDSQQAMAGGAGTSCQTHFDCNAGTVCDKNIETFYGTVAHFGTYQCVSCPADLPNCNGGDMTAKNDECSATYTDIMTDAVFPAAADCLDVGYLAHFKSVLDCEADAASRTWHSESPTGPEVTLNIPFLNCIPKYLSLLKDFGNDEDKEWIDLALCANNVEDCAAIAKDKIADLIPGFGTWKSCMEASVNLLGAGFTSVWVDIYGDPCSTEGVEFDVLGPADP